MKKKFLISGLVLLLIMVIVAVSFFTKKDTKIDKNAINMKQTQKKNDAPSGGGAVTLSFSNEVNIKKNEASIIFENPERSTQDIELELIIKINDQETSIAKSKRIPAGYKLNKLEVNKNIKKGHYEGKFVVTYYSEDSDDKAKLKTDIPVAIDVE